MKRRLTKGSILIFALTTIISCSTNPTAKIQGVYEVNKDSLSASLQKGMAGENALAAGLLNAALKNAVIEFDIKGDSINGILFLAGETTLISSRIVERNDSLIIKTGKSEACLIPTKAGLSYRASGSKMSITLDKTKRTELSPETRKAIEAQEKAIKENEIFEQNLGKWQEGNFVDEFGDKTGSGFAYCLIRGASENSITTKSEVYVKAMVEGEKLNFQIYNSSLSMKESFPDSKFGSMKLKFPDGSVKSERVFFYENSVSESDKKAILYDYISQNNGVVKVYIDLGTASDYYSDKYQFEIEKNNLAETLKGLKK
ncbi:MAG TPA: hypothetical protein VMV56_12660 [Williamwhitmania sp.]|nr:hypothetical protein [Williamwhitmania sp.]